MTQDEVRGRLAEVEFSVAYADGTEARLPIVVRRATTFVNNAIVEQFKRDRGQIRQTGPGRYGVYLDPSLYPVGTWFRIEWVISHPTQGIDAMVPVDYFFRALEDVLPANAELYPDRVVSEVGSIEEDRHLIAREIVRREALLLRRFNGSFCAFLLKRRTGERCPRCYDRTLKRATMSNCRACWDTGFEGGYSKPIYGWVFHWNPARSVQVTQMGEQKDGVVGDSWTTNYPLLSAGDIYVLQDGSRWRIETPRATKLQGETAEHPVRQLFQAQRLDRTDVVMQYPVPDLRRPQDSFVGFLAGETRRSTVGGVTFRASGLL